MNLASNAVRCARSGVFQYSNHAGAFEKRAVLRHLGDIARWSCAQQAYIKGLPDPLCEHEGCTWQALQSLTGTCLEISLGRVSTERIIAALIADDWITDCDLDTHAPAILYTLNKHRLFSTRAPGSGNDKPAQGQRVAA